MINPYLLVKICVMDSADVVLGFLLGKDSWVRHFEKTKTDADLYKASFGNAKVIHPYFICLLLSGCSHHLIHACAKEIFTL